eukprot:2550119-Rhodomonas_salina.1
MLMGRGVGACSAGRGRSCARRLHQISQGCRILVPIPETAFRQRQDQSSSWGRRLRRSGRADPSWTTKGDVRTAHRPQHAYMSVPRIAHNVHRQTQAHRVEARPEKPNASPLPREAAGLRVEEGPWEAAEESF